VDFLSSTRSSLGSHVSPPAYTPGSTQQLGTILALPASSTAGANGAAEGANGAADGANGSAVGAEGVDGANQSSAVQEYSPDDPLLWEWDNAGASAHSTALRRRLWRTTRRPLRCVAALPFSTFQRSRSDSHWTAPATTCAGAPTGCHPCWRSSGGILCGGAHGGGEPEAQGRAVAGGRDGAGGPRRGAASWCWSHHSI
jgi:hypothetical protein